MTRGALRATFQLVLRGFLPVNRGGEERKRIYSLQNLPKKEILKWTLRTRSEMQGIVSAMAELV